MNPNFVRGRFIRDKARKVGPDKNLTTQTKMWIGVCQTIPNTTAAIRIHGVFDSIDNAQKTVQQSLADQQSDVGAYVLDELQVLSALYIMKALFLCNAVYWLPIVATHGKEATTSSRFLDVVVEHRFVLFVFVCAKHQPVYDWRSRKKAHAANHNVPLAWAS